MVPDPMMAQQMAQPNPQENPLERFKIIHELGRGAIGRVYAARDRSTGAVVALKTLDPALFSEPGSNLAELFLKNASLAARLRHRNIVKVHDAGEAGGTAYVAMELLEGESLRHMLDSEPLSIARAIQIFDDIASALAYAHEEGMVHRGVKPSNIIVQRSGAAKISDFGIGQIGEAALPYMSPEQVRGDPVDHRSDIFSLGVVFYEMLTRRTPFEGKSPKEIRQNILRAAPPPPSEVNPHVPGALDGIVSSMLAGDPDKRLANARLLLRDLQRLEDGLGLGPGANAVTGEPAVRESTMREPTVRVPPVGAEPRVGAPAANQTPTASQPATAAPQPAAEREPRLHIPALPARPASSAAEELPPRNRMPEGEAFDHRDMRFLMDREPWPERSSYSWITRFAALALLVAVLPIGLAVFWYYSPDPGAPRAPASREALATAVAQPPSTAAAPTAPTAPPPVAEASKEPTPAPAPVAEAPKEPAPAPAAPATAVAPPRPSAPPPVAEAPKEPAPAPTAPAIVPAPPRATVPAPVADATQEPSPAPTAPATVPAPARSPAPSKPVAAVPSTSTQAESLPARERKQPPTARTASSQPAAKIPEPQPGGIAKLLIAVSPQGELWIDGKHYGTTPPITTLDLEPGMYRIEIRSGSWKPYLTYMAVQAGDERRIRHDFAAKSSRPPR